MPSFTSSLKGGRLDACLVPGRFGWIQTFAGTSGRRTFPDTNLTPFRLPQPHPAVELLSPNREVVVMARVQDRRNARRTRIELGDASGGDAHHHDDLIGLHRRDAVGRTDFGMRFREREPGEDLHSHAEG